jgi:hypothetical protein
MLEEVGYIGFRAINCIEEDDHFSVGKFFENAKEASDFFGIKEKSLKTIAKDCHAVRGKRKETWMVFHEDIPIIDVESELERRL